MEKNNTLIDYVTWRGDLSFEVSPFNDVDNVILCEVSYLDMTCAMLQKSSEPVTIREAYQKIKKADCYKLTTINGGSEDLIAKIAESERFGNLKMRYYIDHFIHGYTQFSAVTFDLGNGVQYIAYRGTDDSIIGWKEDFMLSFTKTPAQESALLYADSVIQDGMYYIGGHSKGANLAVYAAAFLPEEKKNKVLHVYMNDGPGFAEDVFDMETIRKVYPMTTKIVPHYDIIGQIYSEEIEDTYIVRSTYQQMMQHDMASWCVEYTAFVTEESLDPNCVFYNETINAWAKPMPTEKREAFVNEVFDAFASGGATSMNDITKDRQSTQAVMHSLYHMSDDAKYAAWALPQTALHITQTWLDEFVKKWNERNK